jgi:hypothetical protein
MFRPDLLRNSLQMRGGASAQVPEMLHGRAALVGTVVLFIALGLAIGWLLCTRWLAAVFAALSVTAAGLLAVDVWVLQTLPPCAFELTLTMGAAEIGVALAAWDWSRMRRQPNPNAARRRERRRGAGPHVEREGSVLSDIFARSGRKREID